jgi:hypothetical protein
MTEESEEEEISRIARTMPENEMNFEGLFRNRRSSSSSVSNGLNNTSSSEEEGSERKKSDEEEEEEGAEDEQRSMPMMDEGNVSNREATTGKPSGSAIKEFPKWNEKLASFSEANVKADQAPDKPMDELVRESLDYVHKKYQDHKSLAQQNGENNKQQHRPHQHHSWMSDPRNGSDDYSSKFIE